MPNFVCCHLSLICTRGTSIQWKILVWTVGNFQWQIEQHLPEFLEKRTTLLGIPELFKISYHLILLPEFSTGDYQFDWFAFCKFNYFPIFWSTTLLPFVTISNFLTFFSSIESICANGASLCPHHNNKWFPHTAKRALTNLQVDKILTMPYFF